MARKFKSLDITNPNEIWRQLHSIADEASPDLVKAFLRAVAKVQGEISVAALERALRLHDYERVLRETNWEAIVNTELTPEATKILRDILEAAGDATLIPSEPGISFDIVNPRVYDWIRTETGNLITVINRDTLQAVREVIRRAFIDGSGPKVIAENIRDWIGLNARQAAALDKFRKDLIAKATAQTQIDKLVERYFQKLLKARATMIGRTEALKAANEGYREQIRQAVQDGLLDPLKWEMKWLVTPDDILCEKCLTMKDARRPLVGVYVTGEYSGTVGPPGHPNCRCGEVVKRIALEHQKAA
jgi:hypothetical protein